MIEPRLLDHGRVIGNVNTGLEGRGRHVRTDFFRVLVESLAIDGRDNLLHRLGWRWRRRRNVVEVVVVVVPIDRWRALVAATRESELRYALVRRNVPSTHHRRRLVAGPAGAAHTVGDTLKGHTQVVAHAATTTAMSMWRSSRWGIERRDFQWLVARVVVDGDTDHGAVVWPAKV